MTYFYTLTGIAYHEPRTCRALTAADVTVKRATSLADVPDDRKPCSVCEPPTEPDNVTAEADGLDNPFFAEVAGGVTVGPNQQLLSERAVQVARDRGVLVTEYAWAIPNAQAIQALADHAPLLEIGAGLGYWAWLVEQTGAAIQATDPAVPARGDDPGNPDPWTAVDPVDGPRAVEEADPAASLFVCWPSPEAQWVEASLDRFEGETVVYVGPGRGGIAGSDGFHDRLHHDYDLVETVAIPTFLQCSDRMEVWARAS